MKKLLVFGLVLIFTGCLTLTPRQEELVVVIGSTILYGMTITTAAYMIEQ